ncbi:MAG: NAD(P)-binding domain-containing protein, partial [Ectothiorhodospiraceae bacterium]
MTERVGFIGLGTMGAPMAWNVSRAGYDLRVYNRTAARTEPFAADGVPVAETPRALAADSDIIVVMVTGPEALETVIVGDDGVAAGLQTGALVINMSTVS